VDVTGVAPGAQMRWQMNTSIEAGATGTNPGEIVVSGGGTGEEKVVPFSFTVGPSDPFSVKGFGLSMTDAPTVPAQRAGSDPMELETAVSFPAEAEMNLGLEPGAVNAPPESFKDVIVHVPPGFIGNPTATPSRCTAPQLVTPIKETSTPTCPLSSQIGIVQINGGDQVPLWNMVPAHGAPAQFGFYYLTLGVTLRAKVRPSDYGIDIISKNTSSSIPVPKFSVTMWGVPGDSSHDPYRGLCLSGGETGCKLQTERVPFLRTPTSCPGTPLNWGIEVNTYQYPETFHTASATTPAVEGCQYNPFEPALALTPSMLTPRAPVGVDATLSMPQAYGPDGIAPADLRTATVTLPAGMSINPSSAGGLQACTDTQLGLGLEGAAACPGASKIGTVLLKTPLLDHELGGSVFLRSQNSDDPASGELFRVAIELRSDTDGLDIKLPGQIKVDPVTGQLTTVFDGLPQLPFESMVLHFKTGSRAPLTTPTGCGTYTTHATLVSWSGKTVESDEGFTISGDGHGGPCPARSFAPGLIAGTQNPVAGAYSPFSLRLTRTDGDSELGSLSSLTLPRGLLADVGSVPTRCTIAQADAASCPAASHIGEVTVGAGAGPDPYYVGGDVYLTGAYEGNPFGVAVIVHALAGPFDLGFVVVKGAIQIHDDGSASVTTDPFPRILKGIPLQARDIRVAIDRPHFMVNPTNCAPMSTTGTANSTDGQAVGVSSRFQVGECATLGFNPGFVVSTQGKTRRATGASLTVKVTSGEGQANIRGVHVSLPRALPSRLSTLNQACPDSTFNTNPAACPSGSLVGSAKAASPLLAVPLAGPAYLVSHGGLKFPDLVLVLQGEGITLHLTGHTDIKNGITTSTFDTVPDAPISSFELKLPTGSHSVLAAPRNLCDISTTRRVRGILTQTLNMPATITGQNGKTIHRTTKITVTGCAKHKTKPRKKTKK